MTQIWIWFIFSIVMGCCVGSFLNVVIYRLPAGLSIVSPPSHCPNCDTKLALYDNVPVLGWIFLGGKCRYCKTPISIQYPLAEAYTGLVFGTLYYVYYITPLHSSFPEGLDGLIATWPVLAVHLVMLGALIASTVIDARFFIIPLSIPYVGILIVALIVLPLATIWKPEVGNVVPVVGKSGIGIAAGGAVGLAVACVLLRLRILPLSFDEEALAAEKAAEAKGQASEEPAENNSEGAPADAPAETTEDSQSPQVAASDQTNVSSNEGVAKATESASQTGLSRAPILIGAAIFAAVVAVALYFASGPFAAAIGVFVIISYALVYQPISVGDNDEPEVPWEEHPRPRQEALKEILFLAFPVAGMLLGYYLAQGIVTHKPSWTTGSGPAVNVAAASDLPLWLRVLSGCVCGYLMGGGLIWGTRVLGTLGFGKEAMGLGDVHLLGAIGAVVGAQDIVIIFFLAPFLGLAYALVTFGMTRMVKVRFQPIPYGPHICMATVIMLYGRDLIVALVNQFISQPGGFSVSFVDAVQLFG